MKINFNKMSDDEFAVLEDNAIDGQLNYDEFPPDEYRYFSRLAKLGYKNRHDGWSKEICEQKQHEYRLEYMGDKERRTRFFKMACKMQESIRRGEVLVVEVDKAKTDSDKFRYALQALELILCDEGLAARNGSKRPEPFGCEYCSGVTEWREKLSGEEVGFNFCPICGRIIEEVKRK